VPFSGKISVFAAAPRESLRPISTFGTNNTLLTASLTVRNSGGSDYVLTVLPFSLLALAVFLLAAGFLAFSFGSDGFPLNPLFRYKGSPLRPSARVCGVESV
jgi:hypothetical protein